MLRESDAILILRAAVRLCAAAGARSRRVRQVVHDEAIRVREANGGQFGGEGDARAEFASLINAAMTYAGKPIRVTADGPETTGVVG